MKPLHKLLSAATALLALAACTPEVDDLFDQTAAERAEAPKAEFVKTIEAAPNGWRMQYYGSSTYGGYNVLVKFNGTNATFASEKVASKHQGGLNDAGEANTESSHYKLEQSQGLILSFNEYNNIFHYFSDPVNPDGIGSKGDGMSGDFEFRVIRCTPDTIMLSGKKGGAKIVMVPMPQDQTWGQYLQSVAETEEYMKSRSYKLEGATGREISAYTSYHRLVFEYLNDKEESQQVVAPYTITPEGYKFYKPVEVDGVEVDGFLKGDTDEYFCAANNNAIHLVTYVPSLYESLADGMWFIDYFSLGAYAQPYWDKMREKLKTSGMNKTTERLYWALIGTYQSKQGFHMQAAGNYAMYGMKFTKVSGDTEGNKVTLKDNSLVNNKTGKTYYSTYGMKQAMSVFTNGTKGRTFTLSTDNARHPSYMLLTEDANPENTIKLWYNEVTYVFGDLDADEK